MSELYQSLLLFFTFRGFKAAQTILPPLNQLYFTVYVVLTGATGAKIKELLGSDVGILSFPRVNLAALAELQLVCSVPATRVNDRHLSNYSRWDTTTVDLPLHKAHNPSLTPLMLRRESQEFSLFN